MKAKKVALKRMPLPIGTGRECLYAYKRNSIPKAVHTVGNLKMTLNGQKNEEHGK